MNQQEKQRLAIEACKVRMGIIESTHGAKAGHPGGSLSSADVLAYLYNKELRVDPKNPKWEDRDRFVLSKGASENRMLFMHVLSNVAAEVMVLLDQSFISLFASSAAVETLFSYPGLGSLMVRAIARRDTGTIAGMMIITCMLSSVLSIAEDLLLSVLDAILP